MMKVMMTVVKKGKTTNVMRIERNKNKIIIKEIKRKKIIIIKLHYDNCEIMICDKHKGRL